MHSHAERGERSINRKIEGAQTGLFPAKAGPTKSGTDGAPFGTSDAPVGPASAGKLLICFCSAFALLLIRS
jgi:hypothetical protein